VKCLSDYLWIVENRFGLQQQVNFGTRHGARTVHNQLFKLQGALSIQQRSQVIYLKRRLGICNMSNNSPALKNFWDNFFFCNYLHVRPLFMSKNTAACSVQMLSTADTFFMFAQVL
jgi:hypothetical protein